MLVTVVVITAVVWFFWNKARKEGSEGSDIRRSEAGGPGADD